MKTIAEHESLQDVLNHTDEYLQTTNYHIAEYNFNYNLHKMELNDDYDYFFNLYDCNDVCLLLELHLNVKTVNGKITSTITID